MKYVKEYYENGVVKEEGGTVAASDYSNYPIKASYDPDMPGPFIKIGLWHYYDETGTETKTEIYVNGKPYEKGVNELPVIIRPNE
jgi:antitoxin component YwqK of YwqJK toxin-antitoxin module